ncbi:hypothetical protein FDC64_11350 [Clostridium botulinum]|uniref:hypothetical protein n=1 Tax=Clostridium botulinum TaxID=1491 RepID=UPI0004D02C1D|nr:hypothetical protein [Clostridium botulinum]MBY6773677.1 hypothetical protein [Clostridium botulinum]MBY6864281.1 hypothetical protein [Clostridium botulinum]MBY6984840.1 hypothetical protein [Clostridium botulinum]NFP26153.1 hypothetical protein [Clostridium botulinum]
MNNNYYDVTEVYEIIDFVKNLNKYDNRRGNIRRNIKLELNKIEYNKKEDYTRGEVLEILKNIL